MSIRSIAGSKYETDSTNTKLDCLRTDAGQYLFSDGPYFLLGALSDFAPRVTHGRFRGKSRLRLGAACGGFRRWAP